MFAELVERLIGGGHRFIDTGEYAIPAGETATVAGMNLPAPKRAA